MSEVFLISSRLIPPSSESVKISRLGRDHLLDSGAESVSIIPEDFSGIS